MLTAEYVKEKARAFGADLCGIGDISRFSGVEPQRNPCMILPHAKCVVGFGFRVPRLFYQAMRNKTQYFNYTQLGVKFMDEEFAEIFLLKMAGVMENEGYDACLQRNVSNLKIQGDHSTNPEVLGTYELVHAEPVAKEKPAPEIILDFNFAAQVCGLGIAGRSGHVLTPRFGPFVRFVFLVTDAPLASDPVFSDSLCDHCKACENVCPGHAISENGCDSWQCSVYYRGAHHSNPLLSDSFLQGEPDREAILNGKKRFDADSAKALYPKLNFLPGRTTGYAPCLCGKVCDAVCYEHLKAGKKLI